MFRKILIGTIILGLIGGCFCLAYRSKQASTARDRFQEQLQRATTRNELMKRKYAEEKARVAVMHRKEIVLQGQLRKAAQAAKDAESRFAIKAAEKQRTIESCQKQIGQLNERIEQLKARHAKLQAARQDLMEKVKARVAEIEEMQTEIEKISAETGDLKTEINREKRQHGRCRGHNRELVKITIELMEKYEEKGVTGSLLQKEPFTQIQQVKVENLIQEYADRVDRETLLDK